MFHKVHLRLTLMCAGITALIMIIMSLSYLYVSEKELHRNSYLSFNNDMNTIITNLEQQNVITFEWLSKMEAQSNYTIFVLDNGVPFFYNTLKNAGDNSNRSILLEESLAYYNSSFATMKSPSSYSSSPYNTYHFVYEFSSAALEKDYFGCIAVMEQGSGQLQLIILSSLDPLKAQITEQRFRFLLINILSIIALTSFSWFFTWKLLKPIEESREQQVQFVAAASHELRTPLAVILSCASACRAASYSYKETRDFLHTIESESMRMSGLIEDMLILSRADNQTWNLIMEEVQPDTLLLNSFETFEPMAAEKGLEFSVDLPDIPLLYLSCDKSRIEQVLAILIHNAFSYTPAGGSVRLQLYVTHQQVVFMVTDNGIGIPDEEKDKVFRRFYRVEKSRSAKGHSGLGLSIAAEIVHAHNGTLKVADAPGGGTTFKVCLPFISPSCATN